jgi:hypothetical protein
MRPPARAAGPADVLLQQDAAERGERPRRRLVEGPEKLFALGDAGSSRPMAISAIGQMPRPTCVPRALARNLVTTFLESR